MMKNPINDWGGLYRTPYLVIPRMALEAMPLDWQRRFVGLMEEANATGMVTPEYTVQRRDLSGRFCKDPWVNYQCPDNSLLPVLLRRPKVAR